MVPSTPAFIARMAAAVIAAMLLLGWGESAAFAGTNDVTWSVSPADSTGPDGRRWVDATVDPGQTHADHFAVTNNSAIEVTFALAAADGYITDTGRFNMLPANQPSVDAGSWITVEPSVTVPPNSTAVIPFTLTVPQNVTPGDHAAGIAATVANVGNAADGSAITVQSRVGFRVMTRVTGPLNSSVSVESLDATYSGSWNPFAAGAVDVTFEVRNDGNVAAVIDGAVTSGDGEAAVQSDQGTLLPGDETRSVAHVHPVWPLGITAGEVTIIARTVEEDSTGGISFPAVVQKYTVWAVPWPQMGAVSVTVLVVLAIWMFRAHSRRKIARLIARARDAGYAEADARSTQNSGPRDQPEGRSQQSHAAAADVGG
ncbi:WxL protein peptidoglycan domain-containing protein [Microbacterium sp. 22296]|uniref:WxL protein peptidoglycan domain-containing protein n=1 Tax=Microbacterium sp. 22296 TaxID=3453903 RepID=UPI003F855B82